MYLLTWIVLWLHKCHLVNTGQSKFFFKPWYGGGGRLTGRWLASPLLEKQKIILKNWLEILCQYYQSITEIKLIKNTLDKYLMVISTFQLGSISQIATCWGHMLCWLCSPPWKILDPPLTFLWLHICRFSWYPWHVFHTIMMADALRQFCNWMWKLMRVCELKIKLTDG